MLRTLYVAAVIWAAFSPSSTEECDLGRIFGEMDARIVNLETFVSEKVVGDIVALRNDLRSTQNCTWSGRTNVTCPTCPDAKNETCPACPKPVDGACEAVNVTSLDSSPSDCFDYAADGSKASGLYKIYPSHHTTEDGISVFCDMDTAGGGWTVLQRRNLSGEDFDRNWDDYKRGFGDPENEFWLGNHYLYVLTNQKRMELRVDLEDDEGDRRFAHFEDLVIGHEAAHYKLTFGKYSGDAGNALAYHWGAPFSTYDRNNYPSEFDCPKSYKGGWWFKRCFRVLLNGDPDHIQWTAWRGRGNKLRWAEMKIRPRKVHV